MRRKLTISEFIEKAKLKHGENKYDYSLVNYIANNIKIKIICNIHGLFEITPKHHLLGVGCKNCSNFNKINSDFIEDANLIHNNKYDYSKVLYLNNKTKVYIICKEHGLFEQIPNAHLSGKGCPVCKKSNIESIIKRANTIHNNKYDYNKLFYINARTKVDIICPKHGLFKQLCNNHLKGMGCPVCKSSKGELKIIKFLEKNNIMYKPQYIFDNCRFINKLPFDFYLPDYGICIEYNGEQHYKVVENWGGFDNFLIRQKRDKIKKEYCSLNSIPLVIISYLDQIEDKLSMLLIR